MNHIESNHEGKAVTVRSTFSRETSIRINIQANPAILWALLTSAMDFPRWNSAVVSMKGEIKPGGAIELISTLDEKRTFKLMVKEFEPEKRLVWGDRMGSRVFTIDKGQGGIVAFTMTEKIGGPFFPLFAKSIPSFDESFQQFTVDLKKEAESIQSSKN